MKIPWKFSVRDINGPNAIDPEAFFDQGRLWMVYDRLRGYTSLSFTIRKKFPKQQGFGKRLWAGNMQNGPEGPTFYNPKLNTII